MVHPNFSNRATSNNRRLSKYSLAILIVFVLRNYIWSGSEIQQTRDGRQTTDNYYSSVSQATRTLGPDLSDQPQSEISQQTNIAQSGPLSGVGEAKSSNRFADPGNKANLPTNEETTSDSSKMKQGDVSEGSMSIVEMNETVIDSDGGASFPSNTNTKKESLDFEATANEPIQDISSSNVTELLRETSTVVGNTNASTFKNESDSALELLLGSERTVANVNNTSIATQPKEAITVNTTANAKAFSGTEPRDATVEPVIDVDETNYTTGTQNHTLGVSNQTIFSEGVVNSSYVVEANTSKLTSSATSDIEGKQVSAEKGKEGNRGNKNETSFQNNSSANSTTVGQESQREDVKAVQNKTKTPATTNKTSTTVEVASENRTKKVAALKQDKEQINKTESEVQQKEENEGPKRKKNLALLNATTPEIGMAPEKLGGSVLDLATSVQEESNGEKTASYPTKMEKIKKETTQKSMIPNILIA